MKTAKLKPFFGSWVVEVGETLFPKMFDNKQEAMKVVEQINNKNKQP